MKNLHRNVLMGSKCTFSRFEITIGFFSKISNPSISLLKGNYHHLKSFQMQVFWSIRVIDWVEKGPEKSTVFGKFLCSA